MQWQKKRCHTWFTYSGWSKEGILEFNKIFDNVIQDRVENMNFETNFMKNQINKAQSIWEKRLDSFIENNEREEIIQKTNW